MENDYYVYIHIFPNNKKYIGYSHQKPNRRFRNGKGYKDLKVYDEISKYGWDNIKHEILANNLNRKEAQQKEHEYILLYKTNQSEYGYNISIGTKLNQEQINRVRQRARGNKNMLGKHHSLETKEKMREIRKGKKMPLETKIKKSKPVMQYDSDGIYVNEYYGISEASRITGINLSNIAACCAGKRKTARGFIWKYKGE